MESAEGSCPANDRAQLVQELVEILENTSESIAMQQLAQRVLCKVGYETIDDALALSSFDCARCAGKIIMRIENGRGQLDIPETCL